MHWYIGETTRCLYSGGGKNRNPGEITFAGAGAGSQPSLRAVLRDVLNSLQSEHRVEGGFSDNALAHVFAERRAELESMPGSTSQKPNIRRLRMTVENVVSVGTVLVLTNACLHEWRIDEFGKPAGE